MSCSMAKWKILEDLMILLKKQGVLIPVSVVEDLRAAKSMLKLAGFEGSHGDVDQKAEEYQGKVESYLITEAEKVLEPSAVDDWLKRLGEATIEICGEEAPVEDKFVVGVPRDQKWVRFEPSSEFSGERVKETAKKQNLQVKTQSDGRIVVFGQPENIKAFLKVMTQTATKQSPP
jgi:hypothetical protein